MVESDFCQVLDWDSQFFGYRIGRITTDHLTPELISAIFDWSQDHKIDCLYFLADCGDFPTINLAAKHAYHFVGVQLTMQLDLRQKTSLSLLPPENAMHIRFATRDELSSHLEAFLGPWSNQ